jgi:hypothetical protein
VVWRSSVQSGNIELVNAAGKCGSFHGHLHAHELDSPFVYFPDACQILLWLDR